MLYEINSYVGTTKYPKKKEIIAPSFGDMILPVITLTMFLYLLKSDLSFLPDQLIFKANEWETKFPNMFRMLSKA